MNTIKSRFTFWLSFFLGNLHVSVAQALRNSAYVLRVILLMLKEYYYFIHVNIAHFAKLFKQHVTDCTLENLHSLIRTIVERTRTFGCLRRRKFHRNLGHFSFFRAILFINYPNWVIVDEPEGEMMLLHNYFLFLF